MAKIKIVLNKQLSTLTMLFSVIILSTIIGFGFHLVFAWTGPGQNPPYDNVAPPITSSGDQIINGNLTLNGGNLTATGNVTVGGGNVNGINGVIVNIGGMADQGLYIIDDASSGYPDIYCQRGGGVNTLCEFRTGAFFSSGTVYIANELRARGGISDDGTGQPLDLNDDVHITGNLTVDGTIAGGGGFVWKDAPTAVAVTCDGAWHSLDATGATSANAKAIIISFMANGGRWTYITTRRYGSTSDREGYYGWEGDDKDEGGMIIQGMDSGQVLEYKCSVEGNPNVRVLGYFE